MFFNPPKIKIPTNFETQLLKVRHMSRPKCFYLGFTKVRFKTQQFPNVCGPPLRVSFLYPTTKAFSMRTEEYEITWLVSNNTLHKALQQYATPNGYPH